MLTPKEIIAEWLEMPITDYMGAELNQLIDAIERYGADCAARERREERERCATLIRSSEPELWAAGSDQSFIAGYKAALSGLLAAIRALD